MRCSMLFGSLAVKLFPVKRANIHDARNPFNELSSAKLEQTKITAFS